jgi:hypothetical protein
LPRPLPARVRILPHERVGHLDPACAVLKVTPLLLLHFLEMARQGRLHRCREHRHPILVTFTAPNHNLIGREVHVLHAQSAAFER